MATLNWEELTYKKVAIAIVVFAIANWAISQFFILPRMTAYQRASIMAGWHYGISPYILSVGFICFAIYFVFFHKGRFATHKNRLVIFAMAVGSACGIVLNGVLRLTWHF